MVLVVLTSLMISFIAIFSQLVINQTAKINNSQNALMQNMVMWHAGAVDLAHVSPPLFTPTGCMLTAVTPGTVAGFPGNCSSTLATGSAYLSGSYNSAQFSFYSMAFQSPTGNYVLTFVCTTTLGPATGCKTDTNGFVQLPGGPGSISTGFIPGDLTAQLQRAAPNDAAYGAITTTPGEFLQTSTGTNLGLGRIYSVPTSIPVGAVGILSSAD